MPEFERALYVKLPESALNALYRVGRREYRGPREQAAWLVLEGLRRAGALPADNPATDPRPTAAVEAVT